MTIKILTTTIILLIPFLSYCNDKHKNFSDEQILTLTILMEARGEGIEGMMLVGQVIKNRSIERHKSMRDVCLEKYQFSCWNTIKNNYNDLFKNKQYHIANGIANELLLGFNVKSVKYNHYHTIHIKTPKWAINKKGNIYKNHIFYKL